MKKLIYCWLFFLIALFYVTGVAHSSTKHSERFYQKEFCKSLGERIEVYVPGTAECVEVKPESYYHNLRYKKHSERYWQGKWCNLPGDKIEYRLPDKTRIDCLLYRYAIEVDFAKKWAEAVGQSKYYAQMVRKLPGVVLIVNSPKDCKHYKRLKAADRNIMVLQTGYYICPDQTVTSL